MDLHPFPKNFFVQQRTANNVQRQQIKGRLMEKKKLFPFTSKSPNEPQRKLSESPVQPIKTKRLIFMCLKWSLNSYSSCQSATIRLTAHVTRSFILTLDINQVNDCRNYQQNWCHKVENHFLCDIFIKCKRENCIFV